MRLPRFVVLFFLDVLAALGPLLFELPFVAALRLGVFCGLPVGILAMLSHLWFSFSSGRPTLVCDHADTLNGGSAAPSTKPPISTSCCRYEMFSSV